MLRADTEGVRGARLAVAVGVTLLLLGFAAGTWQPSPAVDGTSAPCDPAIDLSRLPLNEVGPGPAASAPARSAEARRWDATCQDATLPLRVLTWTVMAVGGLVALAGWTALGEGSALSTPGRSG